MSKQNLFPLIIVLFIVVIVLSLSVWLIQRRQNAPSTEEPTEITQPIPTTVEVRVPTPAVISPTSTGVFEEELPKELKDLADQKQALKLRMPLSETSFTITFDFGEDKFIVELKEPKPDSGVVFKQWLTTNYPAIPIDRFIIK